MVVNVTCRDALEVRVDLLLGLRVLRRWVPHGIVDLAQVEGFRRDELRHELFYTARLYYFVGRGFSRLLRRLASIVWRGDGFFLGESWGLNFLNRRGT